MKKLSKILISLLLVVLTFTLVACSSYSKIEKAFVNAGYEVVETNSNAEKMEEETDVAVKTHILYNDKLTVLTLAIIFEFNTTEDMKEFYADSATAQGLMQDIQEDGTAEEFYNKLVEKGYANGNCLLIPIGLDASGALDIMKNA